MSILSPEEAEAVCNICGINRLRYNTRNELDRSLVQLRHFDGKDYFWDIGDHLLLQESETKSRVDFKELKTDKDDDREILETIPIHELLFQNSSLKDTFYPLYVGLSQAYLSGKIITKPLKSWQERDKTVSLFEKKESTKPDLRWTHDGICKNCGCINEHKRLWTESNRSLLQYLAGEWERFFWCVGSHVIIKDQNYGNSIGAEEEAINYVRQHTTIPVPSWIHSWHEDKRALLLMERMPGKTYEAAINERDEHRQHKLTKEDRRIIDQEVAGYVRQLRALRSPRAQTAGGQLLRNFPFWRWQLEARWQLMPTHEETKEDWYQKSLSGVDRTDLEELNRLKETFPTSEPYTFTHGDLSWPNVMIYEKHVSGIIDWEMSGFAPAWWESIMLSFDAPDMPEIPSAMWWMHDWESIYEPGFQRSLWFHKMWDGGDFNPSKMEHSIDEVKATAKEGYEKLRREPIGPPLPPCPSKMKDMFPPRRHMDLDGKWQQRELVEPMIRLPEFSASRWHAQ